MNRSTSNKASESITKSGDGSVRSANIPSPSRPASPRGIGHDEIASRAYANYEKSGCREGYCQENWEHAEHELRHEEKKLQLAQGTGGPLPSAFGSSAR
ncbi:MAG: DUF2934 domain-containing protein [Phycisphaeraceae bacterium]